MERPPVEKLSFSVWERLTRQAYLEGVELHPHPTSSGVMLATSGTKPGETYVVNQYGCSCPAGKQARWCKHRCLFLFCHLEYLPDCIDPDTVPERLRALVERRRDDDDTAKDRPA